MTGFEEEAVEVEQLVMQAQDEVADVKTKQLEHATLAERQIITQEIAQIELRPAAMLFQSSKTAALRTNTLLHNIRCRPKIFLINSQIFKLGNRRTIRTSSNSSSSKYFNSNEYNNCCSSKRLGEFKCKQSNPLRRPTVCRVIPGTPIQAVRETRGPRAGARAGPRGIKSKTRSTGVSRSRTWSWSWSWSTRGGRKGRCE